MPANKARLTMSVKPQIGAEDSDEISNSINDITIGENSSAVYSDTVINHEKCDNSTWSQRAFPSRRCKRTFLVITLLVLMGMVSGALILVATLVNSSKLSDRIQRLEKSVDTIALSLLNLDEKQTLNLADLRAEQSTSLDAVHGNLSEQQTSVQDLTATLYSELQNVYSTIESHSQSIRNKTCSVQDMLQDAADTEEELHLPISCDALPPYSCSGYYTIVASNGSAVRVYCDMTRSCGNVTGGWIRVAELDMTDSSQQCPSGLSLVVNNASEGNDSLIRTCKRAEEEGGCSPVLYDTMNVSYSKVCGRVLAYQNGTTNAFAIILGGRTTNSDINRAYVDGVSLTHGDPRQHIWSFAAALHEDDNLIYSDSTCPCIHSGQGATSPPNFVGDDYFCDTGASGRFEQVIYTDNPLWDGAGCGPQNTCCSFNAPPWFFKQLPQPTTDSIEMRVCRDEASSNEDIAVTMVDLYVQ